MPICSLRVPEASDSTPKPPQSRPILFVKYHEVILAYASFKDGEYQFETTDDVRSAIDEGHLTVSFQFDEELAPIGIILTDNLLHGDDPKPVETGSGS